MTERMGVISKNALWRQAIYPGSFDPIHLGHRDIIDKTLQVFDHVCVARGINPDKFDPFLDVEVRQTRSEWLASVGQRFFKQMQPLQDVYNDRISFTVFDTLLVDVVRLHGFHAVVRGIRNGEDFEYEKNQMYYNEDLGLRVPTVTFISDRKHLHVSSTQLRKLQPFLDRREDG